MNTNIKKIIAVIMILCSFAAVLSSCGEKPPAEEITTGTEIHQLKDNYGILNRTTTKKSTTAAPEKGKKDKGSKGTGTDADAETTKVQITTAPIKVSDVEFVLQNYYTNGVNYGEIQNIRFDEQAFASTAYGYLDMKMTYVGSQSKNLVVKYRAYDENGKLCRDSIIMAKTAGVKAGDTVEHIRFNVPFNTVKVEFFGESK